MNKLIFLIGFVLSSAISFAQLNKVFQQLLPADSVAIVNTSANKEVDSLQKVLEMARLNEANLALQVAQLKEETIHRDSLKRKKLLHQIDSLRKFTKGIPVVVEKDTLFLLYANRGGYTAKARAELAVRNIATVGEKFNLHPDSVHIAYSESSADLMYKDKVLFTLTQKDAMWEGVSLHTIAVQKKKILIQKLWKMKEEYSLWRMAKRIFLLFLIFAGQWLCFKLTIVLFNRLKCRVLRLRHTALKTFSFQGYDLLNKQRQMRLLMFGVYILRNISLIVQPLFSIPLIFIIFPQTESFAYQLLGYVWTPIKNIGYSIVNYIPNLFTIVIIVCAVRYLVKFLRYLANEIEHGRMKINGFYADWALPTFHIIRFLLYAFMIAMVYPYLPGSNSGVFQGISVFVGLIISLGSSTVIGNIIAGLIITYMRPFKLGDRIKLDNTEGDIIEKTPLVTRIKTPKNEVVTIPNSFVMSSHTVNYSVSAREYGLILHTEVTIGYDVPWRQVHSLLVEAALKTPGIAHHPSPFVLETALNDFYPVYQLNAYTQKAKEAGIIYSELHQNIQDCFNKAGVEIMSPHYRAVRDGNETTIPKS